MIFIKGNVPSLKNSKIKTSKGIFPSKNVIRYLKELGILHYSSSKKEVKEYKSKPNLFRTEFLESNWIKPTKQILVGFHFVRASKHEFDFNNANQIIADLMTAHDFIEDDCMKYFIPVPLLINNEYYSYNKNNAGVWIKILN